MAELKYKHSLSDETSYIYWEIAVREIVNKLNNKNSSVELIKKEVRLDSLLKIKIKKS